jgi:ribosomal protein L32
MAVPKKRTSKSKNKRKTVWKRIALKQSVKLIHYIQLL